jgi:predicted alpha/beta-hydrolase family hydrolase
LKRAEHLSRVTMPMLFLQGTRDALADLDLLRTVVARLGSLASLVVFEDADHSFQVRKSSGAPREVMPLLADAISAWMRQRLHAA